MVRDVLKDARYFNSYISALMPRIERFSNAISKSNGNDVGYLVVHLVHLLSDLMYAQYSAGYEANEIRETFVRYLSYVKMDDSLTYNTAMTVLSMGILFDVQVSDIFDAIEYPDDSFLTALVFYNKEGKIVENASEHLLFPKTVEQLALCFDGKVSEEELDVFVGQRWYDLNDEQPWYNAHQGYNNT